MSISTQETVTVIPDRICRIFFEKPLGGVPSLTTVDEKVVGDIHQVTGNMTATYDPADPLDVALYSALEAKVISMRAKRDAAADQALIDEAARLAALEEPPATP